MKTVKILLESTKQDLEMKLWWAEEHDKEPHFVEEIPTLKQRIAEIDEALSPFTVTYKPNEKTRNHGQGRFYKPEFAPEECRDFGYPNEYWQ